MKWSRAELEAIVAPADLDEALDNLVESGMLEGWEGAGGYVYLHGDFTALEAARSFAAETPVVVDEEMFARGGLRLRNCTTAKEPIIVLGRAEYYEQATTFLTNHEWQSEQDRRIWELHCDGVGERRIANKLGIGRMVVRSSLFKSKTKALLPANRPSPKVTAA